MGLAAEHYERLVPTIKKKLKKLKKVILLEKNQKPNCKK